MLKYGESGSSDEGRSGSRSDDKEDDEEEEEGEECQVLLNRPPKRQRQEDKSAHGQGCHIGRLSGKSRPKDVVRARPDIPVSGQTSESADRRQTAPGGRPKRTAAWRTAQVDDQSCGRAHSHPTEKQPGTS
jgi:hypothetical protein